MAMFVLHDVPHESSHGFISGRFFVASKGIHNRLPLIKCPLFDIDMTIQFPKVNMVPLPFYGAKVLFSEERGRM